MAPLDPTAGGPARRGVGGPLDLLVVQATPFCNLDCRYCYLPDRQNTERMSLVVVDRLFARVFESDLVRQGFTVVWHAGEPLAVPRAFYARGLWHRRAPQPRGSSAAPFLSDQRHAPRRGMVRVHRAIRHPDRRQRRRAGLPARRTARDPGRARDPPARDGRDSSAAAPPHPLSRHHRAHPGNAGLPGRAVRVLRGPWHRAGRLQHRGDRGAPPPIVADRARGGAALPAVPLALP